MNYELKQVPLQNQVSIKIIHSSFLIDIVELTYTINQIQETAKAVVQAMHNGQLFAFYGQMGAGKTTLIKAICQELGVTEEVNSPTFAIVNEYEGTRGPIYHFDFYRINRPEEALDFGLFDYFDSGNPCLMEWPECIEPLLPDATIKITITVIDENTRKITI